MKSKAAILLAFLSLGSIVSQADYALSKEDHAFLWIVENNNRVISGHDEQVGFEIEVCRALDCSKTPKKTTDFSFCKKHLGSEAWQTRKQAYCAAERYARGAGSPLWIPFATQPKTAWEEDKLEYLFTDGVNSKRRTIRAWTNPDKQEVNKGRCAWELIDPEKVIVASQELPCGESIRNIFRAEVELDRTYTLKLSVTGDDGRTKKPFERPVQVKDVLIVALGDSFTSGEGNPHAFRAKGQLDRWWDRRCHRSLISYPSLAVAIAAMQNQTISTSPKHSFNFMSFACSGAQVVGSSSWSGGLASPYVGAESLPMLKQLENNLGDLLP